MVAGNKRERITIGVAGAGGDGVVILGSFLQRIAASQGYFSQMPRYYGAQIRGGGSAVKLTLDAVKSALPQDVLDILLCFSWEKYLEFKIEMETGPDTIVIYENEIPPYFTLPDRNLRFEFSTVSRSITGVPQNKNMVALGLLARAICLDEDNLLAEVEKDIELQLLTKNLPAFEAGKSLWPHGKFPELALSPARDNSAKSIIHGNAAMALGAMNANCQAFFGYPITPAAEIMQEMHSKLGDGGGIFLQAEDEIASVGMVIGGALSGIKSMTSTSGPGLDLMTEMIGLASAAEIPVVIIDVQRCGPSTGIPSKSEQSDLNHAMYGGHGDASRVVIAPFDVEGCYYLTIEGFNISQQFQTPVIILSDQWLGQTFVAVNKNALTRDYALKRVRQPEYWESGNYQRYRITEDLVSPMSFAGQKGFIYQTTGLSQNESGAPSFDARNHQRLHEKRWGKLSPLRKRDELVRIFGEGSNGRGIITWGSSTQPVLETVSSLGLQKKVKVCVPELIHPLPTGVSEFLETLDRLLVVEMNYSGQLHRYLRSQTNLPLKTTVYCRAGGSPFSLKELSGPVSILEE